MSMTRFEQFWCYSSALDSCKLPSIDRSMPLSFTSCWSSMHKLSSPSRHFRTVHCLPTPSQSWKHQEDFSAVGTDNRITCGPSHQHVSSTTKSSRMPSQQQNKKGRIRIKAMSKANLINAARSRYVDRREIMKNHHSRYFAGMQVEVTAGTHHWTSYMIGRGA